MKLAIALLVGLWIVSCGSGGTPSSPYSYSYPTPTPSPTPDPNQSRWTTSELDLETKNCTEVATFQQNLTPAEIEKARLSCRCIMEAAAKQYYYWEFRYYSERVIQKLTDDGVIQSCTNL